LYAWPSIHSYALVPLPGPWCVSATMDTGSGEFTALRAPIHPTAGKWCSEEASRQPEGHVGLGRGRALRETGTDSVDGHHARLAPLAQAAPGREIEEDTPEGFEKPKQLLGLLVDSISLGKSQQEGRAEVRITYRFGPSPASDAESDGSFMPALKKGSRS
jgi:hypothetical protein